MEHLETAYFAGGCFWCITPTFRELEGVRAVTSGYSGGCEENPSYQAVKSQQTGHREAIRIDFCPETVSFEELVEVFLSGVDPFDGEGQFIDRGHSYTLAVFYTSDAQRQTALAAVRRLEGESRRPVYISVEPFSCFFRAEEEHQDYDRKNPEAFRRELLESGRIRP